MTAAPAPALQTAALTKRYGYRPVLSGLDLAVAHGEVVALFGPNGAGKSTLLRIVSGLTGGFGGELRLFGQDVLAVNPQVRRRIGLLGHQSFCYEALTGHENLTYYARLYGVLDARRTALDWLERVGLLLFAHEPVSRYSRGMQQRLAIARCLLPEPDLLLLDEPGTGLDAGGADILDAEIAALKARGAGVLLVTHDTVAGLRTADRAVLMSGGRIVLDEQTAGLHGDDWTERCRQAAQAGAARAGPARAVVPT